MEERTDAATIRWIEEHPEVKTLPVHLRPPYTLLGWSHAECAVFRIDTDGNISRQS